MDLTNEQKDIISETSKRIEVQAGPGTGKTTLSIEYAKANISSRILYLVYSEPSKRAARGRFPSNVEVHSSHSFAFHEIGVLYDTKLINNIKVHHILERFPDIEEKQDDPAAFAFSVLGLIESFSLSAISEFEDLGIEGEAVEYAKTFFEESVTPESTTPISHDILLKLYYIFNEDLTAKYDIIIIDEYQDMTPVVSGLVSRFEGRILMIGDNNQRIYGFRGGRGLISGERPIKKSLTYSFRFGTEIALMANVILWKMKNISPEDYMLTGVGNDEIVESISGQRTFISRTNATLIEAAISEHRKGNKVYINGGVSGVKKEAVDIYNLMIGNKEAIKNPWIKKFKNYYSFKVYAQNSGDMEAKYVVNLIDKYGSDFGDVLKVLDIVSCGSAEGAPTILTTAHKAKGLEWNSVEIADDFADLYSKADKLKNDVDVEELNLLYVAVTRGIRELKLNKDLLRLIGE